LYFNDVLFSNNYSVIKTFFDCFTDFGANSQEAYKYPDLGYLPNNQSINIRLITGVSKRIRPSDVHRSAVVDSATVAYMLCSWLLQLMSQDYGCRMRALFRTRPNDPAAQISPENSSTSLKFSPSSITEFSNGQSG